MGQTNPLETSLLHDNVEDLEDNEVKNDLLWMDSLGPNKRKNFEALGATSSRPILSIKKLPIIEKGPLSTHL